MNAGDEYDAGADDTQSTGYTVTRTTIPPMPTSQEEWECHWAFNQLAIAQRNAAWREVERRDKRIIELVNALERRMT